MKAATSRLSVFFFLAVGMAACGSHAASQKTQDPPESQKEKQVTYQPTVVELRGVLIVKTFFGPPNFGEDPKSDTKERAWILSLKEPTNVQAYDVAFDRMKSFEGVREVQLVLSKPHPELNEREVTVRGTLFSAHTGHHHTEILMDVQSINSAGGGERTVTKFRESRQGFDPHHR